MIISKIKHKNCYSQIINMMNKYNNQNGKGKFQKLYLILLVLHLLGIINLKKNLKKKIIVKPQQNTDI